MDHVAHADGRPLTPDRIDERVDRHDLTEVQDEDAEQRSLAGARQVDLSTVDKRLEPPKNPKSDLCHGRNKDLTPGERPFSRN